MKILIVGFTKLKYMPYMNFYLDNIDCENNEVHIFYWNRDCKSDVDLGKNVVLHEFTHYQEDEVSKVSKIASFRKYRKQLLGVLNQTRFDRVVVLHTLPGVLINSYLCKYLSGRFILDYRDYTYEKIGVYRKIVAMLVKHSIATFVSSDGFRQYLPKSEHIYTSHNILMDSLNYRDIRTKQPREHMPIRVAFWGFIRHEEINKEIIRALGNDSRFELHYYGREQETALNLKEFCSDNCYGNLFFHGEYSPVDRYEFAKNTDIIHNLYDLGKAEGLAMGNKYYDGIAFRIPQLCMTGSYMGECISKEQVGLVCDPYESGFADKVFAYYSALDSDCFANCCNLALNKVTEEYHTGRQVLSECFSER